MMPTIRFRKPRAPLQVEAGSNLMQALLTGGLPVASSCGGEGVCAKCRVETVDGADGLSPRTDLERSLAERHQIPANERISCQTCVDGDITVDTGYW
jgi:ferredoxin, 2Fe-2S